MLLFILFFLVSMVTIFCSTYISFSLSQQTRPKIVCTISRAKGLNCSYIFFQASVAAENRARNEVCCVNLSLIGEHSVLLIPASC